MLKIINIIAFETNGKSYNTYKYSYDSIGVPSIDYDNDENRIIKWYEQGETIKHKTSVDLKQMADTISKNRPIFTYFLDGSRRVFKVDDIAYNKQVFPIVAGQIGVGCCRREQGRMYPEKYERQLLVVLPDKSNCNGWGDTEFFANKTKKINKEIKDNKLEITIDAILSYQTSKVNSIEDKYEDKGIAVIQDRMIEAEKKFVSELVKENKLGQSNYLLKDGSLEYKPTAKGKEDFRTLQKIKNNYRWVVGVSKSFNPESLKDYTGKPNANYIADLPLYHRTPVARFENPSYMGDVKFAVWYIRIRDKGQTLTPFDGVLKVEKILMDFEIEDGIDSDTVDLISANIINERNPTCYGKDKRWANHLYPVFLTELFIKSKYISTQLFLNLF